MLRLKNLKRLSPQQYRILTQSGGGTYFGSAFSSEESMTCYENLNKTMRYSMEAKGIFGAQIERKSNHGTGL